MRQHFAKWQTKQQAKKKQVLKSQCEPRTHIYLAESFSLECFLFSVWKAVNWNLFFSWRLVCVCDIITMICLFVCVWVFERRNANAKKHYKLLSRTHYRIHSHTLLIKEYIFLMLTHQMHRFCKHSPYIYIWSLLLFSSFKLPANRFVSLLFVPVLLHVEKQTRTMVSHPCKQWKNHKWRNRSYYF